MQPLNDKHDFRAQCFWVDDCGLIQIAGIGRFNELARLVFAIAPVEPIAAVFLRWEQQPVNVVVRRFSAPRHAKVGMTFVVLRELR